MMTATDLLGRTSWPRCAKEPGVSGSERSKLATKVARAYGKGASVRELADQHGRSYGFIHRLLIEVDAVMRGRGRATRAKTKKA